MTGNVRYPAERPGLASEPNGGGREATSRYRKESASSPPTRMAVTTTGLTKRYGDACVVNSVNLAVPEHAVYGFLGPNGAGKSTTMKMLLGLVHPTEGSATILGTPLTPENRLEVLRHVGSLIESPSCYPHLTARENLEIVRQLRGLPKSEIDEVLRIVRLDDPSVRRKRVGNFSLGMKQRLGIAAALMGRPPLLLLDEPTNGLDPAGIHEIRALVKELPRMFDMTVVVSSHLLSEVDQMADHVGIIRKGQMVWQGPLAALHARGRHWIALKTTDNARALELLPGAQTDPDDAAYLRIKAVDDATAARLSLGLAERSVGVVRMEEHEDSLEDIFLAITGMEETL